MCMKTRADISIEEDVKQEAREKGINMSQVAEEAIKQELGKEDVKKSNGYPFELCERYIPEYYKKMVYGCIAIKARRCQGCDKIFFVNDPKNEFKLCRACWDNEQRTEKKSG